MSINTPSPVDPEEEKLHEGSLDQSYKDRKTVTGKLNKEFDISVVWDNGNGGYTILIPQDESSDHDGIICISGYPSDAKCAFDFAVDEASKCYDGQELLEKTQKFVSSQRF